MEYPDNQLFKLSIDFSIPWLKYYNQKGLLKVPEVYLEKTVSKYETMLEYKLKELNVNYIRNHRKLLDGLEVDFYLKTTLPHAAHFAKYLPQERIPHLDKSIHPRNLTQILRHGYGIDG